jgi:hypothetical protein
MAESSLTRYYAKSLRPSRVAFVTTLILVLVAAGLIARGYGFYALDVATRVEHEDFRVLSPSAPVGHGYGIVGTLLILTNLLYLARRRIARFRVGSMQAWLNMHVVTGLVGSVLILFHSAFQLRTPIATLTAASLVLVVVTGVIGRWFYAIAPKPDPTRMAELLIAMDELVPGLAQGVREMLRGMRPTQLPPDAGLLRSVATMPRWLLEARATKRAVRALSKQAVATRDLSRPERATLQIMAREAGSRAAADVRAEMGATLLRSWRGLHRFLAILMIVSVTVHIAVAWFYGYRWIWSE